MHKVLLYQVKGGDQYKKNRIYGDDNLFDFYRWLYEIQKNKK